jgi:hypothetical protein
MTDDYTGRAAGAYQRLKRLKEQARASLPGLIASRMTSSHTLHEEPLPWEATHRVMVMVYPQDPFVGEAETRSMLLEDIQPGLINSRVQIEDSAGVTPQPDDNGNYLFTPGSIHFDQVNAFYYTTLTLRMYERYARRALPWAFAAPRLKVDPHVGSEANAFYDEQERMLGFHTFTPTNGDPAVSTAQSADIVSHEAAHAVLDGLRDLWNESFGLGTTAFHESFGDMTAVLVALHDDSLVRRVLSWTKDDLHLDNFVAAIAEQLTDALSRQTASTTLNQTIYVRNALNTFTAVPFDTLTFAPENPAFTLSRQPHSYSRLFTGAFYDILIGIYDHLRKTDSPHIALVRARDILGNLLVTAVEAGPVGELDFTDMAKAFIAAEHLMWEGELAPILIDSFVRRGFGTQADFETFRKSLQSLPHIRLPDTINTALASALYLEDQLIPALGLSKEVEYVPMSTYRNADGYAYLTYYIPDSMTLEGVEFGTLNGVKLDLFGGLSLAFSPDNLLRTAIYRPVTGEDKRQIRIMVQDVIREGRIVDARVLNLREDVPQGIVLPDTDAPKLVRYPVIVDHVRRGIPTGEFIAHLRRIIGKA